MVSIRSFSVESISCVFVEWFEWKSDAKSGESVI